MVVSEQQRRRRKGESDDAESAASEEECSGDGQVVVFPASFAQRRLCFLDRLEPESPLYNVPLAFRLRGPLSAPALAGALTELTRRHEALRTTFAEEGEETVQVVAPPGGGAPWAWVDLRGLPAGRRDGEARRLAEREARRPFDLARGPLFRAAVIRVGGAVERGGAAEHLLVLGLHHAITDGWSLGVLGRELSALYRAARAGAPPALPDLPIQYGDYALWQGERLSGELLAAELTYWRQRLAGAPPALDLPADRPRPAVAGHLGATRVRSLPSAAAHALSELARAEGASPFMAGLALFATLLHRYTQAEDLVVATPVAGREREETRGLIGLFVNTLAVRVDLSGAPGFRELLRRVRRGVLADLTHQELPFERLVAALQPERSRAHDPLAQVMAAAAEGEGHAASLALPGIAAEVLPLGTGTVKFDLALTVEPEGDVGRGGAGGLAVRLDYRTDLFDGTTIDGMLAALAALAEGIAADPYQPVNELPLLSPSERHRLLREWNDAPGFRFETDPPAPSAAAARRHFADSEDPALLHAWVERQARLTPDAVAVATDGVALSYGELDRRAGQLADQLAALGVGPEVPVGVAMERRPELVVALLGILKAGGAYLPLDPAYPAARLALMLDDAQAPVVLTERHLVARLPETAARGGVALLTPGEWDGCSGDGDAQDRDRACQRRQVAADQASTVDAQRIGAAEPRQAPSGADGIEPPAGEGSRSRAQAVKRPSTHAGNPAERGPAVELSHGITAPVVVADTVTTADNLAYLIYTSGSTGRPKGVAIEHRSASALIAWAKSAFTAEELTAVFAATSINFDLSVFELFVPLACGGRVVLGRDALELPRLGEAAAVTLVNTVPSAMAELLRQRAVPPSVVTVNLAGEPLTRRLAGEVHETGSVRRLLNLYGPSEDTTYSTIAAVPAGVTPTIGRPVAGSQAYLLDRRLRPVPRGAAGELCLGGRGLSRGYLRRPALTAERYVPDPFGPPGSRLYRTGDLARHRAGGELEYLGRFDHQVKVRGFRIELGEVEAALLRHPAVGEAVVVAQRPAAGDARLVAYLAAAGEGVPPSVPELRRHLAASLPDYMVPSRFVVLDELPRTPNGKVDRRALPDPEVAEAPPAAAETPAGPVEEVVAAVWSEVLGVERIGRRDDFFELGGHSLLATRVVARLEEAFGVALGVGTLFDAPSVAELAAAVGRAYEARAGGAPPPLERAARDGPLPLSFAQQRLWFLDRLEPGSAAYLIPVALRLAGRLQPGALAAALTALVRRHEALRTAFTDSPAGPVQEIAPLAPTALPLPVVDLAGLPAGRREGALARAVAAASARPFDLARAPLLRGQLFRLGAEEHLLLVTLHHVAGDLWSIGILVRELTAFYRAATTDGAAESAGDPLPIQYADYAVWQRRWLAGETLRRQLDYWRRRLAGVPTALELPTDRPRPAVAGFRGRQRTFRLDAELTAGLRLLGRRCGATPFMTLAAGFLALLGRLSGRPRLAVGTTVAGRTRSALEGLIGFFVNTLVLDADLGDDPPFAALLGRVRAAALAAYAHQDLPFERLVEELSPGRDRSRAPLVQVVFQLLNAPVEPVEVPGLAVSLERVEGRTAKFDLVVNLREEGDGFRGLVNYSTDLFDPTTVERLIGHYRTLLGAAAAEPDRRVSALDLLTPAERHQLAFEQAGRGLVFPVRGGLGERFAARAAERPDAVAVVAGDLQLSYGELARRSAALAARLRAAGVGPEVRVGLCCERSAELVVAILAVLRAGGAYVPIDPRYPEERQAFLLGDSGAALVLADAASAGRLPPDGPPVLVLDAAAAAAGRSAAGGETGEPARVEPAVDPRQAAYVIYTSGSTGKPKGVVVTHGNVVRLLDATAAEFGFGPDDVWTLFHSYAFDFSVWELWGALAYGGRLVVVPYRVSRSPDEFYRLLVSAGVTVLNQTPSAFRQLQAAEGSAGADPALALRWVIFGGEALELRGLVPWFERHGEARPALVNMYGITETTVHVTFRRIGEADARAGRGA